MIIKPTTDLMKKYLLMKLNLPISMETILIDNQINVLKRIKEEKKVEEVLKKVDYQIGVFFDKMKVSR